ncbi:MAG: endonuclease [Planctomycetaceae bacterium]|nr:endonuclease [Planctomycetaceae bacterium]
MEFDMRHVDRSDVNPPQGLIGIDSPGAKEIARAAEQVRVNGKVSGFTFRAYKRSDVRHALEQLFHGKCAYCESRYDVSGPVDIEHFRPKGEVDGVTDHKGYWWLAASWDNLLPSCLDCNRRRYQPTPGHMSSLRALASAVDTGDLSRIKTGKNSVFPISGNRVMERQERARTSDLDGEDALLLNPCADIPNDHLRFYIDPNGEHIGVVFARTSDGDEGHDALPELVEDPMEVERKAREAGISARGAVSIQVYGLNRLAVLQERTRILYQLEFLGDMTISSSSLIKNLKQVTATDGEGQILIESAIQTLTEHRQSLLDALKKMTGPEAPFSVMAQTWLEDFTDKFAD